MNVILSKISKNDFLCVLNEYLILLEFNDNVTQINEVNYFEELAWIIQSSDYSRSREVAQCVMQNRVVKKKRRIFKVFCSRCLQR